MFPLFPDGQGELLVNPCHGRFFRNNLIGQTFQFIDSEGNQGRAVSAKHGEVPGNMIGVRIIGDTGFPADKANLIHPPPPLWQ